LPANRPLEFSFEIADKLAQLKSQNPAARIGPLKGVNAR
jgi:hypothetical protein